MISLTKNGEEVSTFRNYSQMAKWLSEWHEIFYAEKDDDGGGCIAVAMGGDLMILEFNIL
jgi:hypothetical protein